MDNTRPIVLERISLSAFMQYILKTHAAPSTLIICSTKQAFLQDLHEAITTETSQDDSAGANRPRHSWTTPTLRLLASSRTVKVVFCPDLPHLRVYLAAYAHLTPVADDEPRSRPGSLRKTRTLAILNHIQLHRTTSAYSAQGVNRTFAAAVEAAHHTRSRLVLAECPSQAQTEPDDDVAMDLEAEVGAAPSISTGPWDEEVSLLNVTTKSFGAGERGWVGRTVKVRTVAERWCVFQDRSPGGE